MGEVDRSSAAEVEMILTRAVASGDPVIVDLQHAKFVDSSILGAIIKAQKQSGRRGLAVVIPANGEVRRVFDLVDAEAMFVLVPTLRHAVEWCYPTDTDLGQAV
jgi:anti-anti-sigma factor